MQTNIKVAIIGAGAMAREHARVFSTLDGVQLTAIHSRTRHKAEALAADFGITHVCDSVSAAYEASQADLVIVAVSDEAAKTVGLDCMAHPWSLLMEKPPGITPDETRELLAAAQTHHRRVFVGLNRRFYSTTQAALQDLDTVQGSRYIHVQDQQNLPAAAAAGFPESVVANWMYKNSIHLIDYFRIFGRGDITAVTPIIPWQPESSQVVLAKIDFSSGDVGMYTGIWDGPGPWAVSISTPEKRWEMRPLEEAMYQVRGQRQRQSFDVAQVDTQFKAGFRLQAEQTVRALQGQPSSIPTLADALATMELVRAIFN